MVKRVKRVERASGAESRAPWQPVELGAAQFQTMLEAAPDAMVIVNQEGRILAVNRQAEKLFGYDRGEIVPGSVETLVPERFRESHPSRRMAFFANPQTGTVSRDLELYALRKDGTEFPVEISVSLLETGDGQVAVSALRDITERRRTEKERALLLMQTQKSLEQIRALHEIDVAITSTFDLQTILGVLLEKADLFLPPPSATTIRLLNTESSGLDPVACRGIDEERWRSRGRTVLGTRAKELFEGPTPYRTIVNLQTDPRVTHRSFYLEQGLTSHLGIRLRAKEKNLGVVGFYTKREHQFSAEEITFLLGLADRAALAIYNANLYYEMKDLAAELSRANRVKDEFLSVMSHELRTPLTVLIGYAQLMSDGVLGEVNDNQKSALHKMLNRSTDLMTLINNLLQATKIEAEAVDVDYSMIQLGDFLDRLKSEYTDLPGKDLMVEWDYPSNLPAIRTDGGKLKQILQNLINNAIKFTAAEGSVTVQTRCPAGAGWVEFEIVDTGIGIPRDSLSLIFERFRQVDGSDTRAHGGAGVGLFIVKEFTELLGGKVEVESEFGKGSRFKVTLPC